MIASNDDYTKYLITEQHSRLTEYFQMRCVDISLNSLFYRSNLPVYSSFIEVFQWFLYGDFTFIEALATNFKSENVVGRDFGAFSAILIDSISVVLNVHQPDFSRFLSYHYISFVNKILSHY